MKLIINSVLVFIARGAYVLLAGPFFIIGLIITEDRAKYLLNIAISYDQLANTVGGPLFNLLLRKIGGHKFGNPDETISFVLGQLKASGHLTKTGKFFADMLNRIEKDHVENAKS